MFLLIEKEEYQKGTYLERFRSAKHSNEGKGKWLTDALKWYFESYDEPYCVEVGETYWSMFSYKTLSEKSFDQVLLFMEAVERKIEKLEGEERGDLLNLKRYLEHVLSDFKDRIRDCRLFLDEKLRHEARALDIKSRLSLSKK